MKQLETTQAAIVSALERERAELDKVCQSLTYFNLDGYVSYKRGWEKAIENWERCNNKLREESIKLLETERWRREKTYPKRVHLNELGDPIHYDKGGNKPQFYNYKTGEVI